MGSMTREGWNFSLGGPPGISRNTILPGESLSITGVVNNTGLLIGTVYVIVKIASSYDHAEVIFDSNAAAAYRNELRLVDIPVHSSRSFEVRWRAPSTMQQGHYDVAVELWSPPKLFLQKHAHCFENGPWRGAFQVVDAHEQLVLDRRPDQNHVFISYAWQSDDHVKWVRQLADLLKLNGVPVLIDDTDLHVGDDAIRFMEECLRQSRVIIPICSESFVKKANERAVGTGVGFEATLISKLFHTARDKKRFLPVLRDSDKTLPAHDRTPLFLGTLKYIDMDRADWRLHPFQELLDALRRLAVD